MVAPGDVYEIYRRLAAEAATVRDFQVAAGQPVSGTVQLLLAGDRDKLLARWGEEIDELCGVLDGTHADPYIVEATQCFYWASLYGVTGGATRADIGFEDLPRRALDARLDDTRAIRSQAERLVALGPERVPPAKPFLLWAAADLVYRARTPRDRQRSVEDLMRYDLHDMRRRDYLRPIIREVLGEA